MRARGSQFAAVVPEGKVISNQGVSNQTRASYLVNGRTDY